MQHPTLITSVSAMSRASDVARCAGSRVALVPTMGALHKGHMALVREAKSQADLVVVSIFVNPTQFGPTEDFERYPKSLEEDHASLSREGGVDILFAPSVAEMYPPVVGHQMIWIDTRELEGVLCGKFRPNHFRGVATVVAKLLNTCKPQVAVFGLKDAQQFVILREMISNLSYGVEIVGVQTQREPDGLALSSRNRYLEPGQRTDAVVLSKAVRRAAELVQAGERDPKAIEGEMVRILRSASSAQIQYASLVDARTLAKIDTISPGQEVLSAVAVYFGETRLIDNTFSLSPAD